MLKVFLKVYNHNQKQFFFLQHHTSQARTKILSCYLPLNLVVQTQHGDVANVKVVSDYGAIQGSGKSPQCDLKHSSFDKDEFLQYNCLCKISPFKSSSS